MYYLDKETKVTSPFKAALIDDVLYPCETSRRRKELFVYGKGWLTYKKAQTIPTIQPDGDKTEYLNKYGKFCLFYALTGEKLGSEYRGRYVENEFKCAVALGFDVVETFTQKVNDINNKIRTITLDKHGVDISVDSVQTTRQGKHVWTSDLFKVSPCYTLCVFFLTNPYIDAMADDALLWNHHVAVNGVTNEDNFPVQMRERLEFLFDNEVATMYEKLLQ
jgi:hypothetical protein